MYNLKLIFPSKLNWLQICVNIHICIHACIYISSTNVHVYNLGKVNNCANMISAGEHMLYVFIKN